MMPTPPRPYRNTSYALPTAPLAFAQRIPTPDGAQLATFVYGELKHDATPVLALHGNGGSHSTFAAVIDRLIAAGLAVVAFDARAQGQSTRGTAALTYEQLAADAITVLDALQLTKAHVVGHSDGGIEALLLARDYAPRIASIVAGGANLTPEGVIEEPSWDIAGSIRLNRDWASYWSDPKSSREIDSSQIDRTLLPSPDDTLLSAELLQLMEDEPHIEAASLGSITCPACVLVGEHDCITREETEAIASAISGARLVTIPGVGHSLPRLVPDSVALQVLTNICLA
ncbi:MAG: alpha/beta hydrolase [Coriobacteriales bacterium]|nr:alpha/beta hydrolase [Coriobacteriales bacterium]